MKKSNLWLINFYRSQQKRVNKKIINLLDQKDKFINLENQLINRNDYINFLKNDINKMEEIIRGLANEI